MKVDETVVVNLSADECLFESPRNLPTPHKHDPSGLDLSAHKAQSDEIFYYTYEWMIIDGLKPEFVLLSEDDAKKFLIERAGLAGQEYLLNKKSETFEKYFPGIFEEDA